MWTKSTNFSKLNEQLQQDLLTQLEPIQQKLELPDDVATALIHHRIIAHQTAKAKTSPQLITQSVSLNSESGILFYQKLLTLGTEFNHQAKLAIAEIVTQAKTLQTLHPQISTSQRTAGLVIGVVGVGAIAIAVPVVNQFLEKPSATEASFSSIELQRLNDAAQSGIWLAQANEFEGQRNWKGALAALNNLKGDTTSAPISQRIDRVLAQHFKLIDQQYLSTFDAKAINKLRTDTRIAPASLPKNHPIVQKIEAKIKAHRTEWQQNEEHLANSNKQLNKGLSALDIAAAELKKIKLLGKTVKKGSSYWNQKIQPVMVAIASNKATLTAPKPSYVLSPVQGETSNPALEPSAPSSSSSYPRSYPSSPSRSSSSSSQGSETPDRAVEEKP